MSVKNAIIGFPRWTAEASYSGGSWSATYAAGNLNSEPLARVARSTDAALASTQFVATLTTQRPVRLVAPVRHNLTRNAKMRGRIYSDAGMATLEHDTGWFDVWPIVYPLEYCNWEDPYWWTGKYTDEEMAGYTWTRPVWLDRAYIARTIKVEFDDTANPAGYVELGLFEIAQGWQPSVNFRYGKEFGFVGGAELQEALGGVEYADDRPLRRVVVGSIGLLPHDEAMMRAFELQRQYQKKTPFLWFPDPANETHWLRECFLARNGELPLLALASHGRDNFPFSLREVL